ncbi:MAG TPA: hypothetical protein DCS19_09360 [Flavobacterium sp.]|nr:hypothetical protein [Flavobacterium sp.]
MAKNKEIPLTDIEIQELQNKIVNLEKQIESLLIENENLSKTVDFLKQEKPTAEKPSEILITSKGSVFYKGKSYMPNDVISEIKPGDESELLKYGVSV